MITFLPYSDFNKCAKVLDRQRLGIQRLEAKWVLEHLIGEKKYFNHPLLKLWLGYESALCEYGIEICQEWINRGYIDNQLFYFESRLFHLNEPDYPFPIWSEQLYSSHRTKLITKFPQHYSQFGWKEIPNESINYFWPN